MQNTLSWPYYMYPGTPFQGYYSHNFNNELHKLYRNIINIGKNPKVNTLFHLTIGSPMEEVKTIEINTGVIMLNDKEFELQLYQIIPVHLIRAAENGINVINYIVCPNKIEKPMFMLSPLSSLANIFRKISDTEYHHKILPIKILIFNTMMPTNDMIRNNKNINYMINNITKKINENDRSNFNVLSDLLNTYELYRQTEYDLKFINEFYKELNNTINNIINNNGYCSCFSFAVFNNNTEYCAINSYQMFKEIISCYKLINHNKNLLLCEWIYQHNNYNVYDVLNDTLNKLSICYAPSDKLLSYNFDSNSKALHIILRINDLGNIICDYDCLMDELNY